MRLLQWNIWYEEDIKNILKVLKDIQADIICLQELTVNHKRHEVNTAQYLADELGFNFFFKESQTDITEGRTSSFGNSIFTRYPILKSNFEYIQEPRQPEIGLSDYSQEGRVYIESAIQIPDRILGIGTVHMSYTDKFLPTPEKEAETDVLIDILKEKKHTFLLTDDLNSLPGSYTIQEIMRYLKNVGPALEEKTWTTKPFSYKGFDANTLDWRLDYCFATPDIIIKSAQIVDTTYSDHLPILLDF